MRSRFFLLLLWAVSRPLFADGLGDNDPTKVRQVPPPGLEVPAEVRTALATKLAKLEQAIQQLRGEAPSDLLPDVQIFARAVRTVLDHDEFYSEQEFGYAHQLLDTGLERARLLAAGTPDWTQRTGLVVRGFQSKIDHTVQPYGLVLPENTTGPMRLDVWFHGRGERTTEVGFLHERSTHVGRYAPPNTIVLHPYGRYSNAFKFAGETDVLEAIAATQKHYQIDPDRISVRGFSMGGAACWQFAVHYADQWFAANPGAGFSETPEFLRFFQKETLHPTWYEKKLWRWYDCNGYAMNLMHCPTIAYSGELDIQKQAADIMEQALAQEDIDLLHVIGPQTKHTIHEDSKVEIERRMQELARLGRDRLPRSIDFRTYTLKYNKMHWVRIDGLGEHWEPATVHARLLDGPTLDIHVEDVTGLSITFPAGTFADLRSPVQLKLNDTHVLSKRPQSDRSWSISLVRQDGGWIASDGSTRGLQKRHNLQGPIDDAFLDSFIFVRPDTPAANAPESNAIDRWVQEELQHAIQHWRQQFRGDARVQSASTVTPQDVADANLVLFGTPRTNPVMARILDQLPITWTDQHVQIGKTRFEAQHHVPLLIYPNPENPKRYVVFNSGFTYREYAYLNNARQVPMLPDWAVVDVRTSPTSQFPGKVVDADFFDEQWQVK